jgi:predicted peroxiredoxin
MHFVISATYGPTDPTRAMLPFIFAASAVQSGDQVTLMLFADAVFVAVDGAGAKLVPVGPPNRYEEVAGHAGVTLLACKPCADARGLAAASLDKRVRLAGMNEMHAAAKLPDARVVNF